ncbi:hypothetical protein TRFO_28738 [Tritrichomonas foetus]|uniref:Uncharacterized protein n=1 Tax=Tritrichomonas foetus TaxID=1144522 RepID=A0A1J4JZH8_9EUKA|nr:hypothetical protein TRFO_28738 [Tritrichomonas foetus]|eukprot:OHT03896.1 hypothetical protein TRFO_28738 [Tritrichomonas foetus]
MENNILLFEEWVRGLQSGNNEIINQCNNNLQLFSQDLSNITILTHIISQPSDILYLKAALHILRVMVDSINDEKSVSVDVIHLTLTSLLKIFAVKNDFETIQTFRYVILRISLLFYQLIDIKTIFLSFLNEIGTNNVFVSVLIIEIFLRIIDREDLEEDLLDLNIVAQFYQFAFNVIKNILPGIGNNELIAYIFRKCLLIMKNVNLFIVNFGDTSIFESGLIQNNILLPDQYENKCDVVDIKDFNNCIFFEFDPNSFLPYFGLLQSTNFLSCLSYSKTWRSICSFILYLRLPMMRMYFDQIKQAINSQISPDYIYSAISPIIDLMKNINNLNPFIIRQFIMFEFKIMSLLNHVVNSISDINVNYSILSSSFKLYRNLKKGIYEFFKKIFPRISNNYIKLIYFTAVFEKCVDFAQNDIGIIIELIDSFFQLSSSEPIIYACLCGIENVLSCRLEQLSFSNHFFTRIFQCTLCNNHDIALKATEILQNDEMVEYSLTQDSWKDVMNNKDQYLNQDPQIFFMLIETLIRNNIRIPDIILERILKEILVPFACKDIVYLKDIYVFLAANEYFLEPILNLLTDSLKQIDPMISTIMNGGCEIDSTLLHISSFFSHLLLIYQQNFFNLAQPYFETLWKLILLPNYNLIDNQLFLQYTDTVYTSLKYLTNPEICTHICTLALPFFENPTNISQLTFSNEIMIYPIRYAHPQIISKIVNIAIDNLLNSTLINYLDHTLILRLIEKSINQATTETRYQIADSIQNFIKFNDRKNDYIQYIYSFLPNITIKLGIQEKWYYLIIANVSKIPSRSRADQVPSQIIRCMISYLKKDVIDLKYYDFILKLLIEMLQDNYNEYTYFIKDLAFTALIYLLKKQHESTIAYVEKNIDSFIQMVTFQNLEKRYLVSIAGVILTYALSKPIGDINIIFECLNLYPDLSNSISIDILDIILLLSKIPALYTENPENKVCNALLRYISLPFIYFNNIKLSENTIHDIKTIIRTVNSRTPSIIEEEIMKNADFPYTQQRIMSFIAE